MPFIPPPPPPSQPSEDAEYADARAPDDDSLWRQRNRLSDLTPEERSAALVPQCEERLKRAMARERPRSLIAAMRQHSCTAIKGDNCAKCRVCPAGSAWEQVSGYYNGQKKTVYICAEKEQTEQELEKTLTHELLHAYDHCRFGMRVPFVGHQAPWALTCAATACSEVRAYLLSSFKAAETGGGSHFGSGGGGAYGDDPLGGSFGGDGGGFGGGGGGSFGDPYGGLSQGSPGSSSAELSDRARIALYRSALTSTELFGPCQAQGKDPRAVLDAVFNACTDDAAPFGPTPVRTATVPERG